MTDVVTTDQRPPLEIQRAILTQMRDNLQASGFEAEINAQILAVQTTDNNVELTKAIADHTQKAENSYKSAQALSELIAALPAKATA
jgi:hypothetical protein